MERHEKVRELETMIEVARVMELWGAVSILLCFQLGICKLIQK